MIDLLSICSPQPVLWVVLHISTTFPCEGIYPCSFKTIGPPMKTLNPNKACPLHPINLQKCNNSFIHTLTLPLTMFHLSFLAFLHSISRHQFKTSCSLQHRRMLSYGSSQHIDPAIEKLIICFINIQDSLFEIFSPST